MTSQTFAPHVCVIWHPPPSCRVGLSKTFAEKHRAMQHMFQFAAELYKSKWIVKILETDSGLGVDHVVTSPADAWLFSTR